MADKDKNSALKSTIFKHLLYKARDLIDDKNKPCFARLSRELVVDFLESLSVLRDQDDDDDGAGDVTEDEVKEEAAAVGRKRGRDDE